ncbi:MAG: PD-(D/E)XK nuclease family protein [Holosporaceae bacterium]|nr:PD-(D/E)XK nuclease family protein [Holosporaceae bacterium]
MVHEDPSTEATQKLPKERMFRMKSIGAVEGEASVPGIVESAEFPSPALEALGVAIAAKEAMDDGKSVLIVCSESKLSEKITMELRRWSIVPDDSLGIPFSKTADGVAVSLTVDMIKGDFKLSDGLNALKVGGLYADTLVPFELFCRKLRFPQENFFAAAALYGEEKLPFIKKITDICAAKFHAGSLQQWLDYCREFLQIINPSSCDGLVEVAKKFSEASHLCGDMDVAEFATFLKNQILAIRIRSATGHSEGIVLVGIIEAQLLDADLVIIAGTTEENLTASDTNDFWMNKSTLESFGVRSDDAKNIFVQSVFERLVHKSRVLITRSRLVSGSRAPKYSYLDKIETTLSVTRATRLEKLVAETWDFVTPEPLKFSPPVPALEDRPSKFSASDINLLLNDAYGFYAKKILRLEELNHPGATRNLRGNYLHEILEILIKKPKSQRNPGTICQIAVEILQKWRVDTVLFGLWFFRLKNIASFVMAHLDEADISRAELSGGCRMLTDSGYPFELFCRADRIDIHPDQSVSIIDYKTTSAQKQARYGYTPQLLVEAIIARNNGFGLGTTDLRNLCIWQLTGSPGSTAIVQISDSREKTLKLLEEASAGLGKLIEQYNGRGIPYDINVGYRQSKIYHRLARAREWGERRS